MNLLQSLQNTQTQRANQPIPGQAANLRKMLATKSGKVGATTGPAISNVQEQTQLKQFEDQATAQQQAAQVGVDAQRQAQAAQQQQTTQAHQRLNTQEDRIQQQYDLSVDKINKDLQRLEKDINSREGRAALQDAIVSRRLTDKAYMTELNRQGTERRLLNSQDFAAEAAQTAFANWNELFEDQADFNRLTRMDEAEFYKELAKMGPDAARAALSTELEGKNKAAQYSAYGDFANSIIDAGNVEYTTTDSKGDETEASFLNRWANDKPIFSEDRIHNTVDASPNTVAYDKMGTLA